MENGQKKIKELFDGRKIFNIPNYQRAFSWDTVKQIPDFLEDIKNQQVGKEYFLGTILFQERQEKHQGFDVIDIVDGQQRISTLIIFIYVLLSRLRSILPESEYFERGLDLLEETYIDNKGRPKLRALAPDDDFFQAYIVNDRNGLSFIETPSQRRLYLAKAYFEKELASLSANELLEMKVKLDEFTKVLTYSVKDTAEATLIFETTNDRGKGLTNLEKIKSFLMYKTYLAAGENVDRYLNTIQARFADIFRNLESLENRLDEDAVLLYHCIAFEAWSGKEDYQQPVRYVKDRLNPLIASGANDKALKLIERFSLQLKETFTIVRQILDGRSPNFRDLYALERLGNFYSLLIKSYKSDASEGKSRFEMVCKFLEIFSFRVFGVNKSKSNAGQSHLYTLARDFNGRFDPLLDKLNEAILRYSPKKQFGDYLQDVNLYDWIGSRDLCYLFWKYENHLRSSEQPKCSEMSVEELKSKDSKSRLSVEHIAAQTPNSIVNDASIIPILSEEFLENHIDRLGNLTFDPASANSSKGNRAFESKNDKHFRRAPFKTQNELEAFLDHGKWSANSIDRRQAKIVAFCVKNWNPEYYG